jgi:phenylalanine-4-hydroxylase
MFAKIRSIIRLTRNSFEAVMTATHIYDTPPPGCAVDWTMSQNWNAFADAEHDVWDRLLAKQSAALDKLASRAFLRGLDILNLSRPGIPDHRELNERLKAATEWEVVAVPGWIPNEPFFTHLANKRFPAANFLRTDQSMDYNEEPDMFHDIFGHIPMLTDPVFSDFLVAYGKAGLRAEKLGASDYLGRLWLYTVEFGLVVEDGELRAYGGGLLSSLAEAISAVTSPSVRRLGLDIPRVMRTGYHFDKFQDVYFVVDSFEDLLLQTEQANFAVLYEQARELPELDPSADAEHDQSFVLPALGSQTAVNGLSKEQRCDLLPALSAWSLAERGEAITRHFEFGDFVEAFGFMTRVAIVAERMNHHPEWANVYNQVDVRLTTHDVAGLSMRDIELARAMDQLAHSA